MLKKLRSHKLFSTLHHTKVALNLTNSPHFSFSPLVHFWSLSIVHELMPLPSGQNLQNIFIPESVFVVHGTLRPPTSPPPQVLLHIVFSTH